MNTHEKVHTIALISDSTNERRMIKSSKAFEFDSYKQNKLNTAEFLTN